MPKGGFVAGRPCEAKMRRWSLAGYAFRSWMLALGLQGRETRAFVDLVSSDEDSTHLH
jgi:hypothetical protein